MKLRIWGIALGLVLLVVAAGSIWIVSNYGWYGVNVVMRRGGTIWVSMKPDDKRLTPSMRLALKSPEDRPTAGAFEWQTLAPGFETAEIPVLIDGREVDRVMINRIDMAHYRLVALNDPMGQYGIYEWEKKLPQAALIVNGSYFGLKGEAVTPFVSEGKFVGLKPYDSKAGAMVADDVGAHVVDLSHGRGWEPALKNAKNAMVSYPLLIGEDGQNHVSVKSNWLANRTFVAEDRQRRILIGTTKDAYFSLYRLGEFLRITPLDIKVALNLDGGPVACQSVRVGGFHRQFIARWEAQADNPATKVELLTLLPFATDGSVAMPVVLVVTPK